MVVNRKPPESERSAPSVGDSGRLPEEPDGGRCAEPSWSEGRRDILTISVEDYFQVAPVQTVVTEAQWYRFESRVERNVRRTLSLLDEYGHTATFFVLGWIAEQLPEVVRAIAEAGHEVASQGHYHRKLGQMSRDEFVEDLERSREALVRASAAQLHGFRIAHGWFGPDDLWAMEVLARAGFAYDSSLRPFLRSHARASERRFAHRVETPAGQIWEIPLSTWSFLGFAVPIYGGNYQRQIPQWLHSLLVGDWHRRYDAAFVMHFHVWDLDPRQPRLSGTPFLQRVRQYRNLERMEARLRLLLERYSFESAADHLGLDRQLPRGDALALDLQPATWEIVLPADAERSRKRISVVIPCFNEAEGLPYLANTLRSVEASLSPSYRVTFIFVDDGSVDATWKVLRERFSARSNFRLLRHSENRGIAAAIRTGTEAADTEIVCTIDADCTYDPHELDRLLAALEDGVDMVTASPYHPDGEVRNVPPWRLFLSRSLSRVYGWVLPQRLATYTACFRVFRRSAVVGLSPIHDGFLGVAETWRCCLSTVATSSRCRRPWSRASSACRR